MGTAPNGYNTPKTNWQASDIVTPTDVNRIEGNIQAVEEGNRTIDPAQVPTSNIGTLRQFLDWFANRIKAITGKPNWYDAPSKTLEDIDIPRAKVITLLSFPYGPAFHIEVPASGWGNIRAYVRVDNNSYSIDFSCQKFRWDAKYIGSNQRVYFEAIMRSSSSSSTAYAGLKDLTTGDTIGVVKTTSESFVRIRSTAISIPDQHEICLTSFNAAAITYITEARLIII